MTPACLSARLGGADRPYRCFVAAARRKCRLVLSSEILAEYELRVPSILATEAPRANAQGALAWVRAKAIWVEAAPLGKRRSRDIGDERFIAGALAANAKVIVSYDRDLLVLEKPFGISIMRPTAFLRWIDEQV